MILRCSRPLLSRKLMGITSRIFTYRWSFVYTIPFSTLEMGIYSDTRLIVEGSSSEVGASPSVSFFRFFAFFPAAIAFRLCFSGATSVTTLRFFRYLTKTIRKEDRLSPPIPISAKSAAGKAVRHRMITFAVTLIGSRKITGTPVTTARMPASITFLTLNNPPRNVLEPMKFCGIV